VNTVPAAPSTDLLTRAIAGFLVLILIDAAQLLEFYPDRTDTLWAWTIQPPLTAMLLGSVYAAGAYFFLRVMFGAAWHRVAAGFPAIALFVWMAAIATALHLDRFHEDSLPFAAWAALYVTTPFLVPYLYLRNLGRLVPGTPLPRAFRLVLGGVGAAIVAISLVLFVAPSLPIDDWPWTLTPLTARIVATVFALYGATWLAIALNDTREGAVIPLQSHAIGVAILLVAFARGEDAIDWGNPIAPVVVAVAAAMMVTSAVGSRACTS
jgi:hypothetical protein